MKWRNDTWTPISEINGGEKFKKGDGITLKDINALFNNLFYLKGN